MTKFLSHQDGQIAYDDQGSGPLVVCVPSMGDLRAEYRFLAPQLVSAGYRVVTMDVRGHGESSTQWADYSVAGVGADMLALIDALKAGPALLIGTSMAAGAAVWAAAEKPQNVAGLVLIGPFVRGETNWQSRLLYRVLFTRLWGPAVWLKYYAGLYPSRKPEDFDPYRSSLLNNLKHTGRMEALQQMLVASKSASEARLAQVDRPALVLMGSRDPDFKDPEGEATWVAQQLKADCHLISGAGHYPHAEMPDVTGPMILDFIRSVWN
jgi:pimeloyl-ACP methyl ester carboxylesterase